jgi:hypothetical protein
MKSLFFFSLFFICTSVVSAQVINVPDKAQKHFQEKYAGATNIKWSNNVANYDAGFKMEGLSSKAHYTIDGTWDFTEKFLAKGGAPDKVKESFSKSAYRDKTLKSVTFVENNKGEKLYRYEVKTGVTRTYVFFDEEGTLIKTNAVL